MFILPVPVTSMQVVRLPDRKLLAYLGVPFVLVIVLFSVIQAVDPFRSELHIEPGEPRDETFYFCWSGSIN